MGTAGKAEGSPSAEEANLNYRFRQSTSRKTAPLSTRTGNVLRLTRTGARLAWPCGRQTGRYALGIRSGGRSPGHHRGVHRHACSDRRRHRTCHRGNGRQHRSNRIRSSASISSVAQARIHCGIFVPIGWVISSTRPERRRVPAGPSSPHACPRDRLTRRRRR
jgi:hypothetical protein